MKTAFSPGQWFMTPRCFYYILEKDEAALLAYLFGKADQFENDDGWFFCKMEMVMRELVVSRDQHTRLFRRLEKRGFIETRVKPNTMPPIRHIRLVPEAIMEAIETEIERRGKNNI